MHAAGEFPNGEHLIVKKIIEDCQRGSYKVLMAASPFFLDTSRPKPLLDISLGKTLWKPMHSIHARAWQYQVNPALSGPSGSYKISPSIHLHPSSLNFPRVLQYQPTTPLPRHAPPPPNHPPHLPRRPRHNLPHRLAR